MAIFRFENERVVADLSSDFNCEHGLVMFDVNTEGIWYRHGNNPEAVLLLPQKETVEATYAGSWERVAKWLDAIHEAAQEGNA
jgi:hypothetical protein